MPVIIVSLTKKQLSNKFEAEIKSYAKLRVIDNLSGAVSKKLNDTYTRNNISSVEAEELAGDVIKFKIVVDHDRAEPKNSQDVKVALI